ncbi:helix-turn-helix domain-containing protein [Oceaniglobus ichthyenteri]|uniref:helix-turn-helix domain-containing protein n=1 Tax=Oceaniglobus ichthyenteri TaxID=2136177 RepID=UPI000D3891BD|nr:helix-turn-helix domain-containing protein [Oceaniglobus ichthyenteri]
MIVRKLRLEKGLSQEQLAHMAGVSTRTLQRIERGAKASPETLKCIASVLETDFGNLIKGQNMPTDTHSALPELSSNEQKAMEYVRDLKSFYMHALQYLVVMIALTIVNLLTSPGYLWVLWVAFGWGIGLLSHGLSVFEVINLFDDKWERRQIQKQMRRR